MAIIVEPGTETTQYELNRGKTAFSNLTQEQQSRLRTAIERSDLTFLFGATELLKKMIMKNEDSILKQLPDHLKAGLLSGNYYEMDTSFIKRYAEGTLDKRNTYLLDYCEIRVKGDSLPLISANAERDTKPIQEREKEDGKGS